MTDLIHQEVRRSVTTEQKGVRLGTLSETNIKKKKITTRDTVLVNPSVRYHT